LHIYWPKCCTPKLVVVVIVVVVSITGLLYRVVSLCECGLKHIVGAEECLQEQQ
jgi:hypothetical protein